MNESFYEVKNMVEAINDQNFEEETNSGVALIDFWATWCGPCRMQSPVIENLSAEMPNVHFTKMDVDQNRQVPQEFQIMSIPTLLIKKDGKVVDKVVGYHSKEQLKQLLEQYENA